MLIHNQKLNPCKCGSTERPDLDSDDMVPCWGVSCYDCGQFQHGSNWTFGEAVDKWNEENPVKEPPVDNPPVDNSPVDNPPTDTAL